MRCAILADIHANLAAFTAVLDDIRHRGGVEELWCLGDVVGYGPDPCECIKLLRQHQHICVAGNHDWAAAGKIDPVYFNPLAADACQWTAEQLGADDISCLKNLPLVIERGDFTLVHGSPREPVWEYIMSAGGARENLAYFKTQYCLVGHSHVPFVFRDTETGTGLLGEFTDKATLVLAADRLIINPGGVGQPRDGDPRASYAIYDGEAGIITHYRVTYDIAATQIKMRRSGLPESLARRLSLGM